MTDRDFKNEKSDLEKKLLKEWPDLDQKDLGAVLGSRDRLIQKLVQDYGLTYEEAEQRLNKVDS